MNPHDAGAVAELFAEDAIVWEPSYEEPRRGRAAVRRGFEEFFAMLPDLHITIETLMAENDRTLREVRYSATFGGHLAELRECSISRVNPEGQLTEMRVYFDRLTLLRQLGLAADGSSEEATWSE